MTAIPPTLVPHFLDQAHRATSADTKGQIYEDLICAVFSRVPGIEVTQRNVFNRARAEEVDVALWNSQSRKGFYFLPFSVLVECKNWDHPLGANEIRGFATLLRRRFSDHGFLIAANGITGNPERLTGAHAEIEAALREGIRIVVLTTDELRALRNSKDLVHLTKVKLSQLSAAGTLMLNTAARQTRRSRR